ncbi:hypothetical protein [Pseudomonas viridiflava]|uniref:hypothetical protein n=1 Tax=Pseudomonas viridiflava TaxID=33069 RepID=UPI001C314AD1|nr:hypothetical protein [Pseudomonas viridiflava]QXG35507.1 hypothetical protein KTT61_26280 [Pseudomonas viridiflava]
MEPSVQTALNWIDVLKVGLASGVVAAIVGAFFQGLKELLIKKMQTRQEAEIDAIYLITKLEALAVQCANRYWTYGERVSDYNSVGERGSAPSCLKPDVVIDDARLSKVKRNIAARIAWLENEIALGSDIISSRCSNYLDSGDANDQYAELVGYYGRQSLHMLGSYGKNTV